jgi:His/Glu/Gln/Arg/opine family amino acid ABC transporter permease subunit
MTTIFEILTQYADAFRDGLIETIKLALIVWTTGLTLGFVLGALGARYPRALGWPSTSMAFVLSGIPIMVFLFWLHYPLQSLLNVVIDPFYTAALTLSIINIFAVSEIVRRALRDFPKQYLVAAQVCGISRLTSFQLIEMPLLLREILPPLLMAQVGMLQATLFASLISVNEVFRTAQQINATVYKPVEIYTALGVLFLAVCLPLNGVAIWLRNRYTRDLSER